MSIKKGRRETKFGNYDKIFSIRLPKRVQTDLEEYHSNCLKNGTDFRISNSIIYLLQIGLAIEKKNNRNK